MTKIIIILCFVIISLGWPAKASANVSYWNIQSIDTMKYSRDLAREKLSDRGFESIINDQVQKIAVAGATHVAVGTPYDSEFLPFLKKWVNAARANGLNVWFRGNFSGWEGWFGYAPISPDEHLAKIDQFILSNQNLFKDGDIFTPCTECENGVIGDPRTTKNVSEYRDFLIREYSSSSKAFSKIGKNVASGYFSMNGDVASLVMNRKTTEALGGVVVIDHYVLDPNQLADDVKSIAESSGGEVVLGEFGAPIPDIHGFMSENSQAEWIDQALNGLSKIPNLQGVNYWTSFGGTTSLWDSSGVAKPAVQTVTSYFSAEVTTGQVVNELGRPVANSEISGNAKTVRVDKNGNFALPSPPSLSEITVVAKSYDTKTILVEKPRDLGEIVLIKTNESIFFRTQKAIYSLFRALRSGLSAV